ncbi:stAR-related lipid transfer protein 8 isoform X2 [Ambystoma mexicanum]|uniref:stAR-related lipid transfer protein 8 isoform X2 n=1 Tax=Ambystoma mexicanum TaxID=8296 RepID=UPI0037E78007
MPLLDFIWSCFSRAKCFSFPDERKDAEREAKKACSWLRAAGFPQYAQLYEESRFPLNIDSVKKDHSFLDHDALKSLCRRLMTLNSCASMKLEVHFQHKQNDDSGDEDLCAISDRWAFQPDSRRWSRLGSADLLSHSPEVLSRGIRNTSSRDSILTDLSLDLEASSLHSNTSSASAKSSTLAIVITPPDSTSHYEFPAITPTRKSLSDQSIAYLPQFHPERKPKKSNFRRSMSIKLNGKNRKEKSKKDLVCGESPSPPGQDHADKQGSPGWQFQKDCAKGNTTTHCNKDFLYPEYRTKPMFNCSSLRKPRDGLDCNGHLGEGGLDVKRSRWPPGSLRRPSCPADSLIYIPSDHKPGTFPRSLSIGSMCPADREHVMAWISETKSLEGSECSSIDSQCSEFRKALSSCSSSGSRTSIYDNVPISLDGHTDQFDLGKGDTFEHLDAILQHVHSVQQKVETWSKALCSDLDIVEDSEEDHVFPSNHVNFEEQSMSDLCTCASDFDSTGNSLNDAEEIEIRERSDSGVGASLTRRRRGWHWHSFQNSHRPSLNSASLEINRQSSAQLNLLQKFSLLRLTAIMEKYTVSNKNGWVWTVPKFMKRSKVPDYTGKTVFGVPPIVNVQRTGQPLPQSIQQAMRYIRSQCLDQEGIFRKSGVKSRIQALRQMNEASPDHVSYKEQSAYDVADLLKQYFRDLPEPIFTGKLTDTFLQIYQFVPKEQRLKAVQAAIVLMPDENREMLQSLLYFLSDVASVKENQMTPGNLGVCLSPSIFHLNICKKEAPSTRMMQKKGGRGQPDQKDLNEHMAATEGLTHMITECKKLFQIPHDMMLQSRNSYVSADPHPLSLEELSRQLEGEGRDFQSYVEDAVQSLLCDSTEKFRGWLNVAGPQHTELASKKVGDGHPLRLWKVSTEIEAPPVTVLHRVLRERHLWDDDLLQVKVVETLEKNTEVYHYVTDSMAPHPSRDFVVLRKWQTDLPRGACALVSMSLEHEKVELESGVKAVVLASQYLIEPCGMGRSKLTHICRVDMRGRSPDWYNKVFGHLCAMELSRIRNSFPALNPTGPETKL